MELRHLLPSLFSFYTVSPASHPDFLPLCSLSVFSIRRALHVRRSTEGGPVLHSWGQHPFPQLPLSAAAEGQPGWATRPTGRSQGPVRRGLGHPSYRRAHTCANGETASELKRPWLLEDRFPIWFLKTAGQAVGAQNKRTLDFTKLDNILGHPAGLNAGQDRC